MAAVTSRTLTYAFDLVFKQTYQIEGIKDFYCEKHGYENAVVNLACGAIAGMAGQSGSYVLDIIRSKMQTSVNTGQNYKNFQITIMIIYKTEGIKQGFFKGLNMNRIKSPITTGINFATYDCFTSDKRVNINGRNNDPTVAAIYCPQENKKTDWNHFKTNLDETLTLTIRQRTPIEIDSSVEQLTNNIVKAATPITPTGGNHEIIYPMEVRELVKQKRKARKKWYQTRDASDKTVWNCTSKLLHDKIKKVKNETFKSYLSELSATNNTNCSLWKATRCMKSPRAYVPPIGKMEDGSWARCEKDKADISTHAI
ncbi:Mitochondrial carrier domain,Mitochondrial substrate/solute carrier [Cinara cedri]|uniref:Mitochondrial carrier domain,Mitochondrial substrate/solute carrier n=1 Tax=Cinara cedri TaxID=506608 RepID=A0A5E4N258_9HEMI|nr:Mitochondrial carrier domain,Mitochondrial substrate/solute carrier [Cinara cedri]